jgi:4-amino-4-deoxy-L-arabinose transferase-like glycosyltransferase
MLAVVLLLAFLLRVAWLNSIPISLNLDEAINGLDALRLREYGLWLPFLQNNFGRETLYLYLQGWGMALLGVNLFTLRWVSVVAAMLTLPLLYVVGRRLGGNNWMALFAVTGLATSTWHLYFSRMVLRGILLPPLLLGTVWCFWRGWEADNRLRSRFWLGAAGGFLGLTMYTYLAARLLPFLFLLFIIVRLPVQPDRRQKLVDSLFFWGVALLVALPLIGYFWQQPQALVSRTEAISVLATANPAATLSANLLHLAQLHIGIGTWLGRWPALNGMVVVGFVAGLGVALFDWRRAVHQFLLLWWALGMLPVALSVQNWTGETTILRGIVAWPAVFLLAALGLAHMTRWLHRHVRYAHPAVTAFLLLVVGLVVSTANVRHIQGEFVPDVVSDHPPYLARYLNGVDQPVLAPLSLFSETVTYLLLRQQYPRLRNEGNGALPGNTVFLLPDASYSEGAFVLLRPDSGTASLLPLLSADQQAILQQATAAAEPLAAVTDSEQEVIARLYPLPLDLSLFEAGQPDGTPVNVGFESLIQLTGVQVSPMVASPGEMVALTLAWEAIAPVTGNLDNFIHLFDVKHRQRWRQVNRPLTGLLFDANRWPVGVSVPDRWQFQLPSDAPPGAYRFEIGLYRPETEQRLAAGGASEVIAGKLLVGPYPPLPPRTPLNTRFGDGITLLGLNLEVTPAALNYTLQWESRGLVGRDYTVFNHLVNSDGEILAQVDSQPQGGQYPTSWWSSGEIVPDIYQLPFSDELPAGRYTLRIGLYDPANGRRLLRLDGTGEFVELPVELSP